MLNYAFYRFFGDILCSYYNYINDEDFSCVNYFKAISNVHLLH